VDYLITGKSEAFQAFWRNTKVITPREFISLAMPHLIATVYCRKPILTSLVIFLQGTTTVILD
jgi:hypothetical protein